MTEQPRLGTRRFATTLALVLLLATSVAVPAFAGPAAHAAAPRSAAEAPAAADSVAIPPGVNASAGVETIGGETGSVPDGADRTRVTLITGQTVTVVEGPDGTDYRVGGGDRMRKVTTDNATYVYPEGADFDTFDRQLFDIEFLIRQNLTDAEADSIPVIVSGPDRSTVAAEDRAPTGALDSAEGVQQRAALDSIGAAAGAVAKDRAGEAARRFAADDAVDRVTLDAKHRLDLSDTDAAVGASSARRDHGVTGDGVTVAVVDSGIDDSHPAIDRVVAERDFTFEGRTDDPNGHGTHVAGIVASDDGAHTGMAPDASLIDARVLTDDGWGYTSWIISGMEYAVDNGADVISVSIGGSVGVERSNDRYTDAVNSAAESGALVVTSAGNGGRGGYGTISTPGIQSRALTVGASFDNGGVPKFSSRGPTKYGYYLKPDLVAPGWGVKSAESGTGGFIRKTGTSMAAPAVSGVAALVLEKHPDWSPAQVRGALTATADPFPRPDVYVQGAGNLNATDALGTDLVVTPGTVDFGTLRRGRNVSRTVTLANTGDEAVTVDADAAATDIRDGNTENVGVNRSTVTVGPRETTHLALTVDTDVPPGTYSGRLSLGDEHAVIFGFVREHVVTVEKRAVANTSTDGDRVWLFADESGRSNITGRDGLVELDGSATDYHMIGGGTYHVLSEGRDERTGQPILFGRTLTVDGDERVVLNESETTRHDLDTAGLGPLATRNVTVNYSLPASSGREYGGTVAASNPNASTVRFGRSANLQATIGRLLVSNESGSDAAFDGGDAYHLLHRLDGVDGDRTVSVDPDTLAAKNVTYRRAARDESYGVTVRATDGDFAHAVSGSLGDRRTQTVYVNDRVDRHEVRVAGGDGWRLSPSTTGLHGPGERHEVGFNRHPYVGNLRWTVADGTLRHYAAAQTDGAGHRFTDGRADSIRVTRNGEEFPAEALPDVPAWRDTGVAVEPGTDLELTTVGRNGATPLSTETVTTHRARYEPGEDYAPPALRGLDVQRLTANNTAGGELRVRFAVDGESAEAWLATGAESTPFEDPGGWSEGSIQRVGSAGDAQVYEATFDVEEGYLGRVDLAVGASDERGNAMESTTFDAVRVDARAPAVAVTALGATGAPAGVADGPLRTNGTLTMNATAADAPTPVDGVSLALSADFANFRTTVPRTRTADGDWTVAGDLTGLPDDGNYTVRAVARDRFGNANRTAPVGTVALDRTAPELGATVARVDDETGRVNVSADERLRSAPEAVVDLPNGTTADVALNATGDREWTGTFPLADGGTAYAATANGTDLAGNDGGAVSTANVEAVEAAPGSPATVELEGSGAFVRLHTERAANGSVTVTESRSALAPLARNLTGVGFLDGHLDEALSENLANATVGIPADESRLPPDVERGEVEFSYYNRTSSAWERRATQVRNVTVNGTAAAYWVANVTHFSTYGAVAPDDTPPSVDGRTPQGDVSFYGDSPPTVDFTYSDDSTGVDASAVELYYDGERVTDDPAASVTSESAAYRFDPTYGDHTATVTVVDEAGNTVNETTSFSVVGDKGPPEVVTASRPNGAELPAGTDSQRFEFDVTDDASGLDPDAVAVRYDGADVTADAEIGRNTVSYTADSLTDGSVHELELHLEDAAGNATTYTYEFSVADPDPADDGGSDGGGSSGGSGGSSAGGGSSGGGGAGGNVPPPAVQVEVTERGDGHATAKITSARADAPGRVSPAGGLRGGDVAFRTVSVAPASEGPEPRFLLGLDAGASAPAGVPAFADAGRTLGYLTATPTYISDGELDAVTVTFGVDAATTDAPDGVSLYHYRDGDWERLDTDALGTRDGTHRFRAAADATGTFAVGLDEPAFEVRDAALDASAIRVGDAAAATATVENVGTAPGTETVALAVDGEAVATRDVTLAPGERTTVRFERAFEAPGEYDVTVGGAEAGTLAVTADRAEGTATAVGDSGEADGGESSIDGGAGNAETPGFGPAVTVAALVAATLAARRRTT